MPRTSDKRERLVEAARELIHRQGYRQTTLADIAERSGVPLGNVYYYFKTKDDLAAAVIEDNLAALRADLERCDALGDPRAALRAFADALRARAPVVAEHGCPYGSLCQELDKDGSELARKADRAMKLLIGWAEGHLRALGHEADANELAVQLVAQAQGAAVVGHAMRDPELIAGQLERLKAWIDAL